MERNILNRRQLVISCGEQQRGKKVSLHRFRSRPLLVMLGRFEYHEHHSAGRKHGKIISKLIQHTCTKHTLYCLDYTYEYKAHTDTLQVYVLQHFLVSNLAEKVTTLIIPIASY